MWFKPLSTIASGHGSPYFSNSSFSKATSVHTNTDGTIIALRSLNNLFDPFFVADVAWVDPKACSPRLSGLNPSFIVEVNIGHDRHRAFATKFPSSLRRFPDQALKHVQYRHQPLPLQ